jgi:hypothetical protein
MSEDADMYDDWSRTSGMPLALRMQRSNQQPSQQRQSLTPTNRTLEQRISPLHYPDTFTGIANPDDSMNDDTPIANSVDGYYAHKLRKFDQKALNGKKLRKKELLHENNWLHWKSRIMRILRSTGRLHEFALDQLPPPDRFSNADEYEACYS